MYHFQSPWERLHWANDNAEKLKSLGSDITANSKLSIVFDLQPETGNKIHKIVLDKKLPIDATRLVVEIIEHCRHALDQAVSAAWTQLSLGAIPKELNFPFTSCPKDFEGRLNISPLIKLTVIHDALRQIAPFPASQETGVGNGALCALNKAARCKHTINAKIAGKVVAADFANGKLTGLVEGIKWPLHWDINEGHVIICTTSPEGQVDMDVKLDLAITVSGADRLDGGPVIENMFVILGACVRAVKMIEDAVISSAPTQSVVP